MLYSLFPQSLSKFSLVYLMPWHPPLHTPYMSLPNHYLLFATHAHTIATYFAVVLRLCHLILLFLSTLYLELYLVTSHHTSILPFSSLPSGHTACSWKLFVHSHTTKRPKVDRSPASPPNLKHTARHSHDQPILLANGGGAPSPPTSAIKFFLFKMSLHICMCVVW